MNSRVLGMLFTIPLVGLYGQPVVPGPSDRPVQGSMQSTGPAAIGKRMALIIGNEAYASARLKNPVNDATAVADALRKRAFTVTVLTDVTYAALELGIEGFLTTITPGDTVVLFYAGHGMQINGKNYLIPVDFVATNESDAQRSSFELARLQDRLATQKPKGIILILDSCRDNPFLRARSVGRGWAQSDWGRGSLVAYATAPGSTASDEPTGDHGLFTKYFLRALEVPQLDIEQLFRGVRDAVYADSQGKQLVSVVSELVGGFVFTDREGGASEALVETAGGRRGSSGLRDEVASASAAIHAQPTNPAAYQVRGLRYIRAGDPKAAIGDFSKAIQLQPTYAAAFRERGRMLLVTGEYQRAIDDLSMATTLSPEDLPARYLLALTNAAVGHNEAALVQATDIVRIRPTAAGPYVVRCAVLTRMTRYSEAVADCERANRLDSQNASARLIRNIALQALGGDTGAMAGEKP